MTEKTINKYIPLCKIDIDKQIVTGIVLEPEVVDLQGDIYDADTIEKSAHMFLQDVRRVGLMHKFFDKDMAVVESYIAPADFEVNKNKINMGTWVISVKINDKDIWRQVKDGELNGLSIGGVALTEEV